MIGIFYFDGGGDGLTQGSEHHGEVLVNISEVPSEY